MDYSVTNERVFNWMIEKNSDLVDLAYDKGVISYHDRKVDTSEFDMKTMFDGDNSLSNDIEKLSSLDIFNIISIYTSLDALEKIESIFFKSLSEE